MTQSSGNTSSFPYRARTADNKEISGAIDAGSLEDARRQLESLHFHDIQFQTPQSPPSRHAALSGEDFLVFNQQLAQLTQAGLPVEQGLRLVAREMSRSSMRQTIDEVAADLESGKSLPEAVAAHRRQFPPLYSELIDAGIRSGNLSGILLNLGSHLTLIRQLQAMLWQTLSYPFIVLLTFFGVFYLIMVELIPKWKPLLNGLAGMTFWVRTAGGFQPEKFYIPAFTRALFVVSDGIASLPGAVVIAAVLLIILILWTAWKLAGGASAMAELLWLHMPLVGAIVRKNLISRWCHAVNLGVEAGMDLTAAIKLADDATASPTLRAGGEAMIAALSAGRPLSDSRAAAFLSATVTTAMEAASQRGDLAVTLRALSQMYQQQAELRIGSIQAVLTPILLLFIGVIIGGLMIAMFAPLLSVLSMMG